MEKYRFGFFIRLKAFLRGLYQFMGARPLLSMIKILTFKGRFKDIIIDIRSSLSYFYSI